MSKIFLFLLVNLLIVNADLYSQLDSAIKSGELDRRIQDLNLRIKGLIKKDNTNYYPKEVRFFSIIKTTYNGDGTKNDFYSKAFLNHLYLYFFVKSKRIFIQSFVFICDDKGDILAITDGISIVQVKFNNLFNDDLYCKGKAAVAAYLERQINYAFSIDKSNSNYIFGLTKLKSQIIVMITHKDDSKVFDLDDFIKNYWENFKIEKSNFPNLRPKIVGGK